MWDFPSRGAESAADSRARIREVCSMKTIFSLALAAASISTGSVASAAKNFAIAGDLTMHGVTKPVVLTATYEGSIVDAKGRTHTGYTATTTVDRTQWGIGLAYPSIVVGRDISVTIDLEEIAPEG